MDDCQYRLCHLHFLLSSRAPQQIGKQQTEMQSLKVVYATVLRTELQAFSIYYVSIARSFKQTNISVASANEFPLAVWKIGNIGRRIEEEISGKWCALFIKGRVQFSFVRGVSVHKVICWLMFYRENDYWFWCYRCRRGKLPKIVLPYNWITVSSLDKTFCQCALIY